MIHRLLIANRGEIALRIIRTARRLGIGTVVAASDADLDSPAARQADAVVRLGPPAAVDSYLRGDLIIAAARQNGCDAIHPGYGFLAENADFSEAVTSSGLIFVGPPAAAMRMLGSKASAKEAAVAAGIPVVPGYQGPAQDAASLAREAGRIGYPVLLKAVDGGGGRGMRRVDRAEEMPAALDSARREAFAAFGSDRMLVEKLIDQPRHVEVQVFADRFGDVVHLFERDCSLQRRNQKVVEEAPAPGMSLGLREAITSAAVRLVRATGYQNAGTVEFLVETRSRGGVVGIRLGEALPFHFIEMNTRLQVEHPVTEAVTGLDLVEWQLRIASGERLPLAQDAIRMRGHAIELRLNAEDPSRGFQPQTGRIVALDLGGDTSSDGSGSGNRNRVRCDTGVQVGSCVSPYYDSLLAKIIVSADTRQTALDLASSAIRGAILAGPVTSQAFLAALIEDEDVIAGRLDTGLIARKLGSLCSRAEPPADRRRRAAAAGALHLLTARSTETARSAHRAGVHSPWLADDGFQLGGSRRIDVPVLVDGRPATVSAAWSGTGRLDVACEGMPASSPGNGGPEVAPLHIVSADEGAFVLDALAQTQVSWPRHGGIGTAGHGQETDVDTVRSPINGRVVQLIAIGGQAVEHGARIAVVEAMKMEHVVTAPRSGRIAEVKVATGSQVAQGAVIASLEPVDRGE